MPFDGSPYPVRPDGRTYHDPAANLYDGQFVRSYDEKSLQEQLQEQIHQENQEYQMQNHKLAQMQVVAQNTLSH